MKLLDNHSKVVFNPINLAQVIAVHLVSFTAGAYLFTWDAFWFAFATTAIFGYAMGIFHHMYFTHYSFKCQKWIEHLGSVLGTLTWRGPFAGTVQYVAMHRVHHTYSDTEHDPHTPTKGFFHSMLGWFWNMPYGLNKPEQYFGYAGPVKNEKFHVWVDSHVHFLQFCWGVLCFFIGLLAPLFAGLPMDPVNGIRFVVFGVFVRTLLMLYLANSVDLINHTIGYRSYETTDQSTNSFLMFAVHLGGAISWHNNHHAHQGYFTVRKHWWEIDAHYLFLRVLSKFGLVWDIKVLDEWAERERTSVAPMEFKSPRISKN